MLLNRYFGRPCDAHHKSEHARNEEKHRAEHWYGVGALQEKAEAVCERNAAED